MELKQNLIRFFENKSVLILGFGREGRSTYSFLKHNVPSARVAVADSAEQQGLDCACYTGEDYLKSLNMGWDVIMKAPGIPLLGEIEVNIKKHITCQTDLFLRFCKNPTVGITGTKGKSTTSSLIYHILTECGKPARLNGNIGIPVFDDIDKLRDGEIVVSELSCHQLEYMTSSPHIAVLVNIYPDHLDHYNSYEDYKRAKYNIFLHQTDQDTLLICNTCPDIDMTQAAATPSKKIFIGIPDGDNYCGADEHVLHAAGQDFPLESVKTPLLGKHSLCDIATAVTVANRLGVPAQRALTAAESFRGLEHRMEYAGTYGGVKYYNDSISTIPQSTILNAQTVPDLTTLILGGLDRGIDYTPLIEFLIQKKIPNVIFAYDSGKRIYDAFTQKQGLHLVKDLDQAVRLAKTVTKSGSCLFSPAAASYDHFKNFEERGKYFKTLIQREE